MTRLLALWLVAAGLLALVVWEAADTQPADIAPMSQRPTEAAAKLPASDADLTGKWVATALARPLFSPDRRPSVEAATADSSLPGLPRLTAIMVGPFGRSAIFAVDGQKPIVVQEGAKIASYTVKGIDVAQVRVVGPDGARVLYPTFESAPATGQSALPPQQRIGQAALPR